MDTSWTLGLDQQGVNEGANTASSNEIRHIAAQYVTICRNRDPDGATGTAARLITEPWICCGTDAICDLAAFETEARASG